MTKKKIELEDKVEQLAEKYMDVTEDDLDELVNKALPYYIKKKLGTKEVRAILKEKGNDDESSKYLDEYIQNNINSHWNI